jgi:Tfp pilus assembly protein FimT
MPAPILYSDRGHSLVELVYVFIILGALTAFAANPLLQARDQSAVRSAAMVLVSEVARTRALAPLHGGARLLIDLRNRRTRVLSANGAPLTEWQSVADEGVTVNAGQRADSVVIHFDARGFGRVASTTLQLRRRDACGGVIVSAYGRVRQW